MKKVISILLVASVLASMSVTALAGNEAVDISGWGASYLQYPNGSAAVPVAEIRSTTADGVPTGGSGQGMLYLYGANTANHNANAVQNISVTPGNKYVLTGKIYLVAASSALKLMIGSSSTRISDIPGFKDAGGNVLTGQWITFEKEFTPTSASTKIHLQSATSRAFYADDLSVKEVITGEGDTVSYGEELLVNGNFEADFIPPADVTGLAAEVDSNKVTLSWSLPGGSAITNINVYNDGTKIEELVATSTSVVVEGLQNGTEYTFTVKTENGNGESQGVQVKATPIKVIAKPNVSKDDENNIIVGITEEMEYSTDGGANWTRYDSSNAPVFDGDFTVLVRMYTTETGAVCRAETLNFTENSQEDLTPPADVTGLAAVESANTVTLSWTAPNDETISKIVIYNDGIEIKVLEPNATQAVINELQNGTEYTFIVKTKKANDIYSAGVQVKATPIKVLEKPIISKDDENNVIVGITDEMEYSTDNGVSWTRYNSSNVPTFDGNVTVLVRVYTAEVGVVCQVETLSFTENAQDDEPTQPEITGWANSYIQYPNDSTTIPVAEIRSTTADGVPAGGSGQGMLYLYGANTADHNANAAQNISVTPGNKYVITGKIYLVAASSALKLMIGSRSTAIRDIPGFKDADGNILTGQWITFEIEFVPTEESTKIQLQSATTRAFYADDLSVKEVFVGSGGTVSYGEELLVNGNFEADYIPPANVTELVAEGSTNKVILSWLLPDDAAITKIVIYNDETKIREIEATSTSAAIDGLQNGTEYTFTVKTKNKKDIYSSGVQVTATPIKVFEKPIIIKDDESNFIVGITADMEYSIDNGASWTRYDSNNAPTFAGNVTVLVRLHTDEPGVIRREQILYFTENPQSNDEITVTKSKITENTYTVEGKLNKETAAKVTMLMVKKGSYRRDLSKILAVGQTMSDSKGNFTITVKLADKRNGLVNDGEYVVFLDSSVTNEVVSEPLLFVNSERRQAALEAIWTTDNVAELFEETYTDYDAYVAMGFPVAEYNAESSIKSNVIADFKALIQGTGNSIGRKETVKRFTKALVMNLLENTDSTGVYNTIKKYNDILELSYNDIAWENLLTNSPESVAQICTYMAGKEYNSGDDISRHFGGGYGLYLMNNATYGIISDTIKQYAAALGLTGTEYQTYISMPDSTRKTNIDKSIILATNATPFVSGEAVLAAIRNALLSNPETPSNPGGGGGGGGGGRNDDSLAVRAPSSGSGGNVSNARFNDLHGAGWAENAILYLAERGIISGYGDGSFGPNKTITREEVISILVRAYQITSENDTMVFEDVKADGWYYDSVIAAANSGLISGIGNGLFGIGYNITRQDLAVMLYRCIAPSDSIEVDKNSFTDINEVSNYAVVAVSYMKNKGYISGYADGTFKPMQTATRAEVAQILYSVLN